MAGLLKYKNLLLACGASLALAACGSGGADSVASPGEGSFPTPTPTPPTPTPTPPTPTPPTGPAADCPAGFANIGTVAGGTLRACQLPQLITGNLVVPNRPGTVYNISGRVQVGQDQGGNASAPAAGATRGVLTIEPGVRLYGSAGLDFLLVNRGSQIFADGTRAAPIVFTSRQNVEGTTTANSIGQFGGLVILGRGPINNCAGTATPGTATCEAQVEGTNGFYGGNAPADNSGILRYVRVQFPGFEVLPNQELNGITLAGVGNGTTLEYVQVHNSSDDGIEWFGGTVNGRYIVITGADDDSLDTDTGYSGSNQFVLAVQSERGGNRVIEASNLGGVVRTPVSQPRIQNFTFIHRANATANDDALVFNTGTAFVLANGIVRSAGTAGACLDVDDAGTAPFIRSVSFACGLAYREDTNITAAQTAAFFTADPNNQPNATSTLTNTFVNGTNEAARPVFTQSSLNSTGSTFFQNVPYIGAVRDAADTWWTTWTCSLPGQPAC